jgi:hypothetical protein
VERMPESSKSETVERLRRQAETTERAGKHLLVLSASMIGIECQMAVKRSRSLLMEAAALRQHADGIEKAPQP